MVVELPSANGMVRQFNAVGALPSSPPNPSARFHRRRLSAEISVMIFLQRLVLGHFVWPGGSLPNFGRLCRGLRPVILTPPRETTPAAAMSILLTQHDRMCPKDLSKHHRKVIRQHGKFACFARDLQSLGLARLFIKTGQRGKTLDWPIFGRLATPPTCAPFHGT
jgi:hypothetical protein